MSSSPAKKLTYEESCRELQKGGWLAPGTVPAFPSKRPSHGDNELAVEFFRALVKEEIFENLTLPRTFFGRSEIRNVSFKGTDLSESNLCWNDFVRVDFTNCDLSRSDLSASLFDSVKFSEANLSQTDLRGSNFEDCEFSDANLQGAKLTRIQGLHLRLSLRQQQEIEWQELEGEEPGGG